MLDDLPVAQSKNSAPAGYLKSKDASSIRAVVLIGVAAAFCATFVTKPCVASKLAELHNPVACPPQWLPVLVASNSHEGNATGTNVPQRPQMPRLHVLGAMKAGSTSLYFYLVQNHQLCGSLEPSYHDKEPVIWYDDRRLLHRQPPEYFKSWPQAPRANCAEHIDGNPVRLTGHEAPAALHRFATASALELASIRLLAVVREPVAAYLSWYNHRLSEPRHWSSIPSSCAYARQGLAPSFPFFAKCELKSWQQNCPAWRAGTQASTSCDYQRAANGLGKGMYAAQISQWGKTWPRQQLLVVGFESLSRNFSQTIQTVLSFTGLHADKLQLDAARLPHVNSQPTACKLRTIGCDSLNALQLVFRPWNAAFNGAIARDIEDGTAPPEQMAVQLGDSTLSCTGTANIGPVSLYSMGELEPRWVNLSRC